MWSLLQAAQAEQPELIWTENPHADLAELLISVSTQDIHYTVADSTLFKIYQNYVPEIRVGFELSSSDSLAWAFPQRHDTSLIEQAEAYMAKIKENGDLERIKERYYGRTKRFDYVGTRRFMRDFRRQLPRYRDLFESAASTQQMDWRLLAAVGYQESHWNPHAVSPTGVRGIMMLTRNTASGIGIENRERPGTKHPRRRQIPGTGQAPLPRYDPGTGSYLVHTGRL